MTENRWYVKRNSYSADPDDLTRHALFWGHQRWACLTDEQADVLDRLLALDAPSDLPPGVHQAPDGTLLWFSGKRAVQPDGFDVWMAGGVFTGWVADRWYEVRPVAPEPELVPWWEALGRTLPDGREVRAVGFRAGNPHPWFEVEGGAYFADADGMVSVLPETGEEG